MKKLLFTSVFFLVFFHLMYANDGPNVWTTSLVNSGQIWAIVINPTSQNIMYAGSNTTGIWKTTNMGSNWTQMNSGLTNLTVQCMGIGRSNPDVIYCGTSQTGAGAGIYKSTNAGATWTQVNNGIVETSLGIQSIAVNPLNPDIALVAVFDGLVDSPQGLYKTTNGGQNWVPSNSGIGTVKNFLTIITNPLNPNVLYAGTSFGVTSQQGPPHVYKSVDGGNSWLDMSNGLPSLTTDNKPVRCLGISNADTSVLLAGVFLNTDSLSGMYVTTNGGGLWTRRHNGLPNLVGTLPRSCLIRPGSTSEFYVGLGNATNTGIGMFRSTDAGMSWVDFNGGTMSNTMTIRALNFRSSIDSTLFAGGAHPSEISGQGVFEYSWHLTGIGTNEPSVVSKFRLQQNFPNPFNPQTTIEYELGSKSHVTIKVYDMLGRKVSDLIDEDRSAGLHTLKFRGDNLPSGNYFYVMTAEDFSGNTATRTRLMTLLK